MRGHGGVYGYGWGWFLTCLDAAAANEKGERRARTLDAAMAARANPDALDKYLKE